MKFSNEIDDGLLLVAPASLFQQSPQNGPIDRVICFLEVDEQVELSLSAAMHFIEKSARMDGGRFPFFETCLIDLGRDHMRTGRLDLLEDGLLHDL
jgi:hypothetical protein